MFKIKKKKLKLFAVLIIGLLILSGCGGSDNSTNNNDVVDNESDDGFLELTVDWGELDNNTTISSLNYNSQLTTEDLNNPTHVGARVIYPNENSDFKQMTTRETAENEGVITMKIPRGEAVLQVIVVHHNENEYELSTLISGAKLEDMTIRGNQIKKISLNDLELKPFEVRWNKKWENLFDENNHAVITESDIEEDERDIFERFQYLVQPSLEIINPIESEIIPEDMRIKLWGTYEYKLLNTSEVSWTNDSFHNNNNEIGSAPIRVNNEKNKFVSKYTEESSTFTGWLSFEIFHESFNLPNGKYRPLASPYHGLNDKVQPTEFSLEIK